MTILHFHLLLNHVPVLGAVFLVLVFGTAVVRHDSSMSRFGLAICVLLAVITGAVYLTGGAAEDIAEKIPGVSRLSISLHEEAAEIATIAFTVAGILALGSLIYFRNKQVSRKAMIGALACSIIISGLFAWTANLGGNIRHTELQTALGQSGAEHGD